MCGTNKHRYAGFPAILSDAQEGAPWGKRCKLAALVVADVVGFSRLAGAD